MLVRLGIESFFLIKEQELIFDGGLNVITGETGTGKSMTLSALLFLMGQQGDYPEGTAVEAELLMGEEELVLRREVRGGRSKFYLNGLGSTQKVVKESLSKALIFQGQDDRLKILRRDFQRDVFDKVAECYSIRREFEEIYKQLEDTDKRISQLAALDRDREMRIKVLKEELDDVEKVGWSEEEYMIACQTLQRFSEGERINRLSSEGVELIDNILAPSVKSLSRIMGELRLEEERQSLLRIQEEFFHIRRRISQLYESWDLEYINQLNERLFLVQKLERRYGRKYGEVLRLAQELREELRRLESAELDLEDLQRSREGLRKRLEEIGKELSRKRAEGRAKFASLVLDILRDLGLEKALLDAVLEPQETRFGFEDVKLVFSSYGGEPKDLSQVASGGEVSRIALSLFLLSPVAETYILDEIDVGVSGDTSIKIARFLRRLASRMQLIVITHSPALASAGYKHFKTYREGDRVYIRELKEDRPEEVARLMGIINNQTLKGAIELMREVGSA